MTITQDEAGELSAVLAPVIAALAMKAWTATKSPEDSFTGKEIEDGISTEADRIFEGFKDALNEVEGAVEAPEPSGLDEFLALLTSGIVPEGDDPLDLSL
jgi:hypothetical protein